MSDTLHGLGILGDPERPTLHVVWNGTSLVDLTRLLARERHRLPRPSFGGCAIQNPEVFDAAADGLRAMMEQDFAQTWAQKLARDEDVDAVRRMIRSYAKPVIRAAVQGLLVPIPLRVDGGLILLGLISWAERRLEPLIDARVPFVVPALEPSLLALALSAVAAGEGWRGPWNKLTLHLAPQDDQKLAFVRAQDYPRLAAAQLDLLPESLQARLRQLALDLKRFADFADISDYMIASWLMRIAYRRSGSPAWLDWLNEPARMHDLLRELPAGRDANAASQSARLILWQRLGPGMMITEDFWVAHLAGGIDWRLDPLPTRHEAHRIVLGYDYMLRRTAGAAYEQLSQALNAVLHVDGVLLAAINRRRGEQRLEEFENLLAALEPSAEGGGPETESTSPAPMHVSHELTKLERDVLDRLHSAYRVGAIYELCNRSGRHRLAQLAGMPTHTLPE